MFHKHKGNKDGLRYYCKDCVSLRRKEYHQENKERENIRSKQYHHTHKEKRNLYSKQYNQKNRERLKICSKKRQTNYKTSWLIILKSKNMLECKRCHYKKCKAAIDYHHIDPNQKEEYIGRLMDYSPKEKYIKELDKVIPLCSNCHRELHAGRWTLESIMKKEERKILPLFQSGART